MEKNRPALVIFSKWFAPAYEAGGPVISLLNLVEGISPQVPIYVIAGCTQPSGEKIIEDKNLTKELEKLNVTLLRGSGFGFIYSNIRFLWKKHKHYTWYYNDIFMPVWFLLPRLLMGVSRRKGELQIIATRGMLLPGALSQKKWKKRIYLTLYNFFHFWFPCHFHFTSINEKLASEKMVDVALHHIIPNLPPEVYKLKTIAPKLSGKLHIGLIGRIHPIKNLLWIIDVLERLPKSVQRELEISYYGKIEDYKYFEILKTRAEELENIEINFFGSFHPSQQKAIYSSFNLLCCPSFSENYGHSIAQALAWGIPVIASENTPWRDLEKAKAGCTIDPYNTGMYSEKLLKFVNMDNVEWEELRNCVLEYASELFNYKEQLNAYHTMFGFKGKSS